MKNLIITLTLFSFAFLCKIQAQDWKQIGAPDSTGIEIYYYSSHGYIIGYDQENEDIVFSKDKGKTFEILLEKKVYYFDNENYFDEDNKGNIYFVNENKFYKLDTVNIKPVFLFTLESSYIEDFEIMDNGNILLSENRHFYLYDSLGNLIKDHEWWTHSATILTGNGSSKNFVTNSLGASYFILEFSNDLSYISSKKPVDYYSNIVLLRDTLYAEDSFSGDGGVTWKNIPKVKNYSRNVSLGHDLNLYWINYDTIYKTNSIKNDFKRIVSPLESYSKVNANLNGEIIYYPIDCNLSKAFFTINNGLSWTSQNLKIGKPSSYYFVPNVGENIFGTDNCGKWQYKKKQLSTWKEVDVNDDFFSLYSSSLIPMSNGKILLQTDFGPFLQSNDQGETWTEVESIGLGFEAKIIEKDGRLFGVGYDSLYYSNDFGHSWKGIYLTDPNIGFLTVYDNNKLSYLKDFKLFYLDYLINNALSIYDLNTNQKRDLFYPLDVEIVSLATSFSTNKCYLLTRDWNSQIIKIGISTDLGYNFTYKDVPDFPSPGYSKLLTDHLNNIYLMSNKKLLFSSDDGENWTDLTPNFADIKNLIDVQVSYDNYIYLSTKGMGILKYIHQLKEPGVVNVNVFDDLNNNCIREINEPLASGVKVVLNDNDIQPALQNNSCNFYTLKQTNVITLEYEPQLYKMCQENYQVVLDSAQMKSIDIPLQMIKSCANPRPRVSADRLRRCFDNTYHGTVCNEGSIRSDNTKIIIKLDPYFEFISATLPVISHVGNELTLAVGNIERSECVTYSLIVKVSCEAELGQEHCLELSAVTSSQDCNGQSTRDDYVECQENIGSYDPNDKTIFINGSRGAEYVELGSTIEYMIRFQNTGTDTAFTVRIEDPISSKFDLKSINPVASSHDYIWKIENGVLIVTFNKINLVDSFTNEPLSNGFIKFEIALDKETMNGEALNNTAGIFFDFNEPVITNEVITGVGKPVGTDDDSYDTGQKIIITPNPARNSVVISSTLLTSEKISLELFDIHGRILSKSDVNIEDNTLDVSTIVPGTYIVNLKSKNGHARAKFVKM